MNYLSDNIKNKAELLQLKGDLNKKQTWAVFCSLGNQHCPFYITLKWSSVPLRFLKMTFSSNLKLVVWKYSEFIKTTGRL